MGNFCKRKCHVDTEAEPESQESYDQVEIKTTEVDRSGVERKKKYTHIAYIREYPLPPLPSPLPRPTTELSPRTQKWHLPSSFDTP